MDTPDPGLDARRLLSLGFFALLALAVLWALLRVADVVLGPFAPLLGAVVVALVVVAVLETV